MPFFAGLAVVFVGITGGADKKVDQQVAAVLSDQLVEPSPLPATQIKALVRRGGASRGIVRKLHSDGVIGGELVTSHGHKTLKLVIYTGDGGLKSMSEVALAGNVLSASELKVMSANFEDDVGSLVRAAARGPAPTTVAAKGKATQRPVAQSIDPDDDAPPGLGPQKARPKAVAAKPAPAPPPEEHAPPPAKSVAIESEDTTFGTSDTGVHATVAAPSAPRSWPILRALVGFAATSRTFRTGAAVTDYTATPIGGLHVGVELRPISRVLLAVQGERTLSMTTPIDTTRVATSMSRWEGLAGVTLIRSKLELAAQVGVGYRAFTVDSADPRRSPDGTYTYLILGGTLTVPLGKRLAVVGTGSFEPVVAGTEPTETMSGDASRSAFAVGGALEVRPAAHVVVRASAEYQRFAWSWGMVSAIDSYPSGGVSLGGEY